MDNNFSGYNELLDLQLICVIYSPTGGKISTGAGDRTSARVAIWPETGARVSQNSRSLPEPELQLDYSVIYVGFSYQKI